MTTNELKLFLKEKVNESDDKRTVCPASECEYWRGTSDALRVALRAVETA